MIGIVDARASPETRLVQARSPLFARDPVTGVAFGTGAAFECTVRQVSTRDGREAGFVETGAAV